MFSDARSIWNTVGAGIHHLNQNISSALESLDQLEERESESSTFEDVEVYKNLLDEAQLQHVELSKQFRLLIAEKDAEIKVLKQKMAPDYDKDPNYQSLLDMEKLYSENEALRASLQEMEIKLRDETRELNDAKMLANKQSDYGAKYKELHEELLKTKKSLSDFESQKNETIDNLVAEYSKLAAESEQRRDGDAKRIFQLERLQEMYTTKIDALEHSISEFADRSMGSSESLESSMNSPVRSQQQQEIKDLRAKVLHLEYDVKEKESKIRELMDAAPPLPNVQPEPLRDNLAVEQLQEKVASLSALLNDAQSDVLRLQVEKQEAELAGKSMHDRIKALQLEVDEARRELGTCREEFNLKIVELQTEKVNLAERITAMQDGFASTTDGLVSSLRSELIETREQIAKLQTEHEQHVADISSTHSSEIEEMKRQHGAALEELQLRSDAISQELETTRVRAERLQNTVELMTQQLAEQADACTQEKRALDEKHSEKIKELNDQLNSARFEVETLERKVAEEQVLHEQALNKLRDECTVTMKDALDKAEAAYVAKLQDTLVQERCARDEALANLESECEKSKQEELAKQLLDLSSKHAATVSALQDEAANTLASSLEKSHAEHHAEVRRMQEQHVAAMRALQENMDTLQNEMRAISLEQEKRVAEAVNEALSKRDVEHAQAMHALRNEMQDLVDAAEAEREKFLALYTKENKARKAIHNKLLEIQGNIRVMCRVRPILDVERRSGQDVDVTNITSTEDIEITKDPSTKQSFEFDRVFAPLVGQEEVFDAVQPLVVSVLDGYNVCIFAYGQTGSGKTHTMEGYGDQIGVAPRAVHEVFRMIDSMTEDWKYDVTFSILEIYNETIRDLLDNNNAKEKLDVRQGPEGNVVVGLTEIHVSSPEQVINLMQQAQGNRAVGSHDMNEHSSRSHSILTLVCRGKNLKDASLTSFGKLHLIDLAGSERISKTDATGDRLKEAQNINRSLSALGDVIQALGKRSPHVPYRNSKLTFLLQDSLGGNSKVMMFVNISPAIYNVGETVCSLNFAHRCRAVELGQAKRNADDSKLRRGGSSADVAQSPSPAPRSNGSLSGAASSKKLPMSAPSSRNK